MSHKKQSILLFTCGFPSATDSRSGIFVYRAIEKLEERYDATVVHLRAFNFKRKLISREKYEGVDVIRLAFVQIPNMNKIWLMKINTWLYRIQGLLFGFLSTLRRYDLFHSSGIFPTGVIAGYWARLLGKKHITWAIGDDVNIFLPALPRTWVDQKLIERAQSFQFCSQMLQSSFRKVITDPKVKTFVGYNGVELSHFPLKETFNKTSDLNFLFLGGFQTYEESQENALNTKGGHLLLKAWAEIEKDHPNLKLKIGGPGTDKAKLEGWWGKLKNAQNVDIVDRQIKPHEIPAMLWDHDVVIMPSLNEGLPNLANEAQASGTPVLASDTGGFPETVDHLTTGYLFQRGSVEGLKEAILWFVNNADQLELMGRNGRSRMANLFSWNAFAEGIETQFNSIDPGQHELAGAGSR